GVQIGGGTAKEVSKADYDKFTGRKEAKQQEISKEEYDKCVLNLGACWSEGENTKADIVGPNHPGAVLERFEVKEWVYKSAKVGPGNGNKLGEPEVEHVTLSEYKDYKGPGSKAIDKAGNFTITHHYVQVWVKPGTAKKYFKGAFYVLEGFIKDVGKLGDNVGGQGFTW
ncbi:hypothetical protein ACLQ2R_39540, partial [Streptosporangium sp. DT93]